MSDHHLIAITKEAMLINLKEIGVDEFVASRMVHNADPDLYDSLVSMDFVADWLITAFNWEQSIEGRSFWDDIYEELITNHG